MANLRPSLRLTEQHVGIRTVRAPATIDAGGLGRLLPQHGSRIRLVPRRRPDNHPRNRHAAHSSDARDHRKRTPLSGRRLRSRYRTRQDSPALRGRAILQPPADVHRPHPHRACGCLLHRNTRGSPHRSSIRRRRTPQRTRHYIQATGADVRRRDAHNRIIRHSCRPIPRYLGSLFPRHPAILR